MAKRKIRFENLQHAKGVLGFTDQGLPVVEFAGQPRVLAALPPRVNVDLPNWDSEEARHILGKKHTLTPDQWEARDWRSLVGKILNQGSTSACTGFSAAKACKIAFKLSGHSQQDPDFDPFFPYGLVNGGRDQGAIISDVLEELMSRGICLEGETPAGALYAQQFPQSAFQSALKYKVGKAFRCLSFEDMCSAISSGFVGTFGILVGQNFEQLSSEGVAPPPDVVRGGHALCGCGLTTLRSGAWGILTANSWSEQFGMQGFCILTKENFQARTDAYAIQIAGTSDDQGPPVITSSKSNAQRPGKSARGTREHKHERSELAA